eukprot:jgi/Mesvir1/13181/Mv26298-RA.1
MAAMSAEGGSPKRQKMMPPSPRSMDAAPNAASGELAYDDKIDDNETMSRTMQRLIHISEEKENLFNKEITTLKEAVSAFFDNLRDQQLEAITGFCEAQVQAWHAEVSTLKGLDQNVEARLRALNEASANALQQLQEGLSAAIRGGHNSEFEE